MAMLDDVKLALRLTTNAYDSELTNLIAQGLADLGKFGSPQDYDRLKKSYDEQKAQMQTCTGYTDWGDS